VIQVNTKAGDTGKDDCDKVEAVAIPFFAGFVKILFVLSITFLESKMSIPFFKEVAD